MNNGANFAPRAGADATAARRRGGCGLPGLARMVGVRSRRLSIRSFRAFARGGTRTPCRSADRRLVRRVPWRAPVT